MLFVAAAVAVLCTTRLMWDSNRVRSTYWRLRRRPRPRG